LIRIIHFDAAGHGFKATLIKEKFVESMRDVNFYELENLGERETKSIG